jgi:hypothetical protein
MVRYLKSRKIIKNIRRIKSMLLDETTMPADDTAAAHATEGTEATETPATEGTEEHAA